MRDSRIGWLVHIESLSEALLWRDSSPTSLKRQDPMRDSLFSLP